MTTSRQPKARNLPLGLQTFENLRKESFLYVDKTHFIPRLLKDGGRIFLSRPRRFGKSLFLSTLKAYFEGQKELFEGLYIGKHEAELAAVQNRIAWAKYPVLHLDLNAMDYTSSEKLLSILGAHLTLWEKEFGVAAEVSDTAGRFRFLLQNIYEITQQRVVILIDEYDKPLLETLEPQNAELNEQYRRLLKAFYGVLKTCDAYIYFVFVTGVTKFGKVSIFSDLNNLRDISLEEDFSDICGVTEDELRANFLSEIDLLCEKKSLDRETVFYKLKKQYDGYCFAPDGQQMYNPFSLLNAFVKRNIGDYWFYSGTPTFLINYLKSEHFFIPDLDNDNVLLSVTAMENMRADSSQLVPILYQSGYLTIKEYDERKRLYRLGFPNDEVRYAFLEVLYPSYVNLEGNINSEIADFNDEIEEGRVDDFMRRLQAIIAAIPYSTLSKDNLKWREEYYQGIVAVIFQMLGRLVQTEVQCATGRVDAILHTEQIIYIFEFKLWSKGTPRDALELIKRQGYADRFLSSHKQIVLVGVSFDARLRNLRAWETESLATNERRTCN